MKLVLAEPRYFKESVSIISDIVSDVRFTADNDGLQLVAMDPANVAMVNFRLLSSCFTSYELKKPEEIAVSLNSLKQVLRRLKGSDILTLETDEGKLKIEMKSDTIRSFYIPLIELDEKEQRVPELSFPVSVETTAHLFNDCIEDVGVVGDSVTFFAENGLLMVKAEGDSSKALIEIRPSSDTKIVLDGDEKIKAKYSIEYLKKMIGASKLCERVSLKFNSDYPLRLEYKEVDKLMLSFILAPRVDND